MNKPDSRKYFNSDPAYLRSLIAQAGISQREAARRLGISDRSIRYYVSGQLTVPYVVQLGLEELAKDRPA